MKIRTREMLTDFLAQGLAWRKKELTYIRELMQSAPNETRHTLQRCGIALMYAHFEGFTKQAGGAYLEYVAARRLSNDRIATNFLAVSLCALTSPFAGSKKASLYECAVDLLLKQGKSRAHILYERGVDTKSNLSSKVFREVLFTLGLDYAVYEPKEKLIDTRLLKRRNDIAHGEQLNLDDVDYDELHSSIIEIMECLRNQIENAVALRSYERAS